MTMDSDSIIKGFNIFEYKLIGMIVVFDIESVKPFSFNQGMKGFDAGIFIRITL